MAGSSYDPHGSWWALGSALRDQFQTLSVVERSLLPSAPRHVYAFGTSMGGLISALEDQSSDGRLNGALTTCGIVAGANNLNQYQLDGEYALSQLLAAGQNIQLTNFIDSPVGVDFVRLLRDSSYYSGAKVDRPMEHALLPSSADTVATANALMAAGQAAQNTPQGRARLALAMAFLNVSPWGGATIPNIYDYVGQEQGQYDDYFTGGFTGLQFIVEGRNQIEAAADGEGSGTRLDFVRCSGLLVLPEVKALYNEAGLSLRADLANLHQHANLRPDEAAFRWLARTSVPTGHLQVPELDLHTISDQLVPVQQEAYYHTLVARAGDSALLRQAFVQAQGHCNFTSADLIAGLKALESRVATGSWGDVATATQLDTAANALTASSPNLPLGGGDFLPFWPNKVTGAIPPSGHSGFGRFTNRRSQRYRRAARQS